jgi:hypothetical protein
MAVAVYLCICLFVVLAAIGRPGSILNNDFVGGALATVTLAVVSAGVVFREQFADAYSYVRFFQYSASHDLVTILQVSPYDRFWTVLQWSVSRFSGSRHVLLGLVWVLFVYGLARLLRSLFTPAQIALVAFSYATYPFFYSYASNALRQGVAISFVLLGVYYLFRLGRITWLSLASFGIAAMFHWSAVPYALIAIAVVTLRLRLRHIVLTWCVLALLFVTNVQRLVLSPVVQYIPRLDEYTSYGALALYAGVNRLDFLLFSVFWVAFGVLMNRYYCSDPAYEQLVKYYVAWNCVFLLFGFVAFADRLAGYSWFLVPMMAWFPILKRQKPSVALTTLLVMTSVVLGLYAGTFEYFRIA